jgi:hypothetical protein
MNFDEDRYNYVGCVSDLKIIANVNVLVCQIKKNYFPFWFGEIKFSCFVWMNQLFLNEKFICMNVIC